MKPMFFIDSNEISIDVFVVYDSSNGTIISVSGKEIDSALIEGIAQEKYTFFFTRPNYDDISKYRQLSMYWDNNSGKTVINPFKLRNLLILNHLKHWSGVVDENNKPIDLKLDIDDTLTTESLELVYSINSSIVDVLMTIFEQRAMLF